MYAFFSASATAARIKQLFSDRPVAASFSSRNNRIGIVRYALDTTVARSSPKKTEGVQRIGLSDDDPPAKAAVQLPISTQQL